MAPRDSFPLTIPSGDTLTVTGLVGLAGLLFAGLGWLGALRDGIRTIFGVKGEPGNVVTNKLRDLGVLVILGVAIVVSAAVTGIAGAATSWVAGQVGLGGQAWLLSVIAFVVGAVLDGLVVLVMLRLLSGVDVPRRGLIGGAIIGGVGLTLLKVLGATLIAGTTSNPLFASIALVVGLLAWLNLMSRIVLLAAAWSANSLVPEAVAELTEGQLSKLVEGPDPAEVTRSESTQRHGIPTGLLRPPRSARKTGSTSRWAQHWARRSSLDSGWPVGSCAGSPGAADLSWC